MKIWKIFLAAFIISGCATTTSNNLKSEPSNTKIYNVYFQTAWEEIIEMNKDPEVPILSLNKNKGRIVCQRLQISLDEFKRLANLPERSDAGGFKQPWLWARYRQQFQLKVVNSNQTEVKVKVHLEGYSAPGARWITIISNGTKEKEILDELQSRIGQKNS